MSFFRFFSSSQSDVAEECMQSALKSKNFSEIAEIWQAQIDASGSLAD